MSKLLRSLLVAGYALGMYFLKFFAGSDQQKCDNGVKNSYFLVIFMVFSSHFGQNGR